MAAGRARRSRSTQRKHTMVQLIEPASAADRHPHMHEMSQRLSALAAFARCCAVMQHPAGALARGPLPCVAVSPRRCQIKRQTHHSCIRFCCDRAPAHRKVRYCCTKSTIFRDGRYQVPAQIRVLDAEQHSHRREIRNQVPAALIGPPAKIRTEAAMQTVEQYRGFARDCRRRAATAQEAEKIALLEIAEAWESLAAQREAKIGGADGQKK